MPSLTLYTFLAAIVAFPCLFTAWALSHYGVNVPVYDEWNEAAVVFRFLDGSITGRDLWADYNHHRLFFSRLVWLPLARWTNWNILAECWVSWILGVVCLVILLRWLVKLGFGPHSPAGLWLALLFSFLSFSMNQMPRWLHGFHLQIPLSITAALLGFAFLAPRLFKRGHFFCAAGLGVISAYSFSAGLAYWPSALFLLATQSFKNTSQKMIFLFLWLFLGATVYFFHQWHPGAAGLLSENALLQKSGVILPGICLYLGSVFPGNLNTLMGLGLLGLGYFLAECFLVVRSAASRARLTFLSLGGFVFINALLTALARSGLTADNFAAVRYSPIRNLFWISLMALLAARTLQAGAQNGPSQNKWRAYFFILLSVCCSWAWALDHAEGWKNYILHSHDYRLAAEKVLAGNPTEEVLSRLYPGDSSIPKTIIPELHKRRLSLFKESA